MSEGLAVHNFVTGYPRRPIFTGLDLPALPRGEISVLLGPNGCGKSTLLRAMAGLSKATGELWLNGEDLMKQPFVLRAQKVVYLPQSLPQGVHLQVLESVIVAARAAGGRADKELNERVLNLLENLGIAHLALHFLDQLSGGQKQLVGLAQSLIRKPDLLLLDEPLSALDLNYQFHVMDLVARETRLRNMVTLVVVHDINIALHHTRHVVMLRQGKLVASGLPEQVITPESLAEVYGVRGRIERCSKGRPQVLIDGLVETPTL
ncbi:iron ABC transporter ATP-binding protein [Salmonella enterica subsp. enterica serovar Choleraesuis]|nr:iron ABC transporter ATP-binding protein [Salmonella enterica subsp. enterica serovar Choleraesuis]